VTILSLRHLRNRVPQFFLAALLLSLGHGLRSSTTANAWEAPSSQNKPPKPYALIYGTVFGPDGHTVYGVRIKIRPANEKKSRWELYSDHSGEFAQRVPTGQADYVVWADLKGFKSPDGKKLQAGSEVTVHIQNEERADISLHLK
jgi:hypothetical protein